MASQLCVHIAYFIQRKHRTSDMTIFRNDLLSLLILLRKMTETQRHETMCERNKLHRVLKDTDMFISLHLQIANRE